MDVRTCGYFGRTFWGEVRAALRSPVKFFPVPFAGKPVAPVLNSETGSPQYALEIHADADEHADLVVVAGLHDGDVKRLAISTAELEPG